LGHDIRAVIRRIEESPLAKPKSEFETTAQYTARISAFRDKDFQYVFVMGSDDEQFEYNADERMLTSSWVTFGERMPEVEGLPGQNVLLIRQDVTGTTHYVGVNAFGVQKNVTVRSVDEYNLILVDRNGIFKQDPTYGYDEAPIRLPMNADQARDLKPNLRIAIVCTVTSPRVYETWEEDKATLTIPLETYTHTRFIAIRPDQVWVFDSRTGRIVSRRMGAASTPVGQ
jgi:hypothetical protein